MTWLMSSVNQAGSGGDVTLHAWALLAFLSRDKRGTLSDKTVASHPQHFESATDVMSQLRTSRL